MPRNYPGAPLERPTPHTPTLPATCAREVSSQSESGASSGQIRKELPCRSLTSLAREPSGPGQRPVAWGHSESLDDGLRLDSSEDLAHAGAAEHGRVRCGPFERRSGVVPWHAAGSLPQRDSSPTANSTRFTIIFVSAGGPLTCRNNSDLTPRENRTSHDRDPRRARAPRPLSIPALSPFARKRGMSPLIGE